MKVYIDKSWKKRYAEINCNVCDIIPSALNNLEKAAAFKDYKIKHIERNEYVADILNISDFRFNFERFLNGETDISDIVNFALKLYLPICMRNQKKIKIKKAFNEEYMKRFFKKLNIDIWDARLDKENHRVYYYTVCPACGAERFCFSLDKEKQDVFVGCLNKQCSFHNSKGVDVIGFMMRQYNKTFDEALEFLSEVCELNTPYYTNMTVDDFNYFGFNEELLSKCYIFPGQEGENHIVYKNKGEKDEVYVIVYDILDALRIRKNNGEVNILALFSNIINEEQMEDIFDYIPQQAKIVLGLGSDIPYHLLKKTITNLRKNYQQVEVANIPLPYKCFADMMFNDPAVEREKVNKALNVF
jgi:hypothetical protein